MTIGELMDQFEIQGHIIIIGFDEDEREHEIYKGDISDRFSLKNDDYMDMNIRYVYPRFDPETQLPYVVFEVDTAV